MQGVSKKKRNNIYNHFKSYKSIRKKTNITRMRKWNKKKRFKIKYKANVSIKEIKPIKRFSSTNAVVTKKNQMI